MSKIFNSKSLAIALSVVMVVCAFCATLSVSADSENLLAGLSYTYTMNAFWAGGEDTDGTLLTDGAYRGDGTNAFNGNSGVTGVSVEMAGTTTQNKVEFAFDDATSIGTIVIRGARIFEQLGGGSFNRHCKVEAVEITTDGLNYTAATFTTESKGVPEAPLYAIEQGGEEFDQYFDIFVNVEGATDAMGLRVTLTTEKLDGSYAYIVQLDEIEAYAPGVEAPVRGDAGDSSDDTSVEDSSVEDSSVEDSSVEDSSVEDSSVEDSSVEDSSVVVPVADTTYKVVVKDNGDGTVTVTATVPAGIESGKIVVSVSEDLELVAGSLQSSVQGATPNENYDRDGVAGAAVSFGGIAANPEGTVAFTANYNLVAGATLDASDVTVPVWNLSSNGQKVGTQDDGNVDLTVEPVPEPSVPESSVPESSVVDSSVVDSSVVDSSVVDSSVEDSSNGGGSSSNTGDAGIAVFAVLAVLSGAAVVVLKKKA